jgi:hypothetical protein
VGSKRKIRPYSVVAFIVTVQLLENMAKSSVGIDIVTNLMAQYRIEETRWRRT